MNNADLSIENGKLKNELEKLKKEVKRIKYLSLRNCIGYLRDIKRLSNSLKKEMAR